MMMNGVKTVGWRARTPGVLTLVLCAGSCSSFRRVTPPEPVAVAPQIRVDTVTVTRQVPAPLPDGTPAELCLASGLALQIIVATNGDTLIGPRRVSLRDLTGLVFEGRYADGQPWFLKSDPIRFERRSYRKVEEPRSLKCEDLKQVGENAGIPLFADLMVLSPMETIYVPVSPGRFQPYRTTLPRR
jgi:hypothetical protein